MRATKRDGMRVWWDRNEAKVHQTVSQLVGSWAGELWRFGGFPYDFWSHLSKIQTISYLCFSPLTLSVAAFPLHHNICFLSPMSRPLLTVSHLFFSHVPEDFTSRPSVSRLQCSLQLGVLKGHAGFSLITAVAIHWFSKSSSNAELVKICQIWSVAEPAADVTD